MGTSHPLSLGSNNHAVTSNPNATGAPYADIAARNADTAFQITTNLDKVVKVTSPLSYWILESIGPTVWVEFTSTTGDSLAEILAGGNISGGTDLIMSVGDDLIVNDHMTVGGATAPATNTSIDLKATNAAFLFNRLTQGQEDALTPLAGMSIFNTTLADLRLYI